MPYDEPLATRIRAALGPLPDLEEKKMFGGVGFLVNGNPSTALRQAQGDSSGQAWPAVFTKTT